jgi:hypothetical protein
VQLARRHAREVPVGPPARADGWGTSVICGDLGGEDVFAVFHERMQITHQRCSRTGRHGWVLEPMIADSLIGTEADICAKIELIRQEIAAA